MCLKIYEFHTHKKHKQMGIRAFLYGISANLAFMLLKTHGNHITNANTIHTYHWPTILIDCINYSKGCQKCQKYGSIQRIPIMKLHSIVKPWPFRGWTMDLIWKIYLASSKGHNFILVSTNYFTKWLEAVPLKKAEQRDVIQFIKE